MSFASPYLLALLLVVPAVAALAWWLDRRRTRYAVAFRTKKPPDLRFVGLVHAHHVIFGKRVVVTASSTDALSPDAHAVVQGGAECAP